MPSKDKTTADITRPPTGEPANAGQALRRRTDAILRDKAAMFAKNVDALSSEEMQIILLDLCEHQMELEVQNEELQRLQVDLDTERANYLNLYDLAPVGYCTISETGLILRANLTAAILLGFPRGALIKQPISRLIFKEDQDIYYLLRNQLSGSGGSQACELRMVKADGTQFWTHLTCTAKQGKDGAPVLHIALSDITERKQAEAQQAKNAKELTDFKAALDEHAIVATTDARGIITYVNDKFCTISKYAREELIGHNHRIINSGHHPKAFFRELWQTISSGRVWKGEIKNRAKDDTFYWVETTIVPILDEHGKPVQYIAIRADITERKRVEQAVISARDAADMANRTKDSFLATMSHEIRTPLGGLTGMLELLGFTPLNNDQRDTLQAAMDSGQSLLRIVNDILDWSKIEAGKLEFAPQATSISQLVAGVVSTYARVASVNSLIIEQHVDARLGPAHIVDPLRLSQVLNNFVSNALKFTPKGRVDVRAELLGRHDDAEQVRFSVKDTGVGIEKEIQKRLFQSYNQGSAETARMYGGTGLGLAICRSLASMMGGQIDLESVPGLGSTFSITLTLPVSGTATGQALRPSTILDVEFMQHRAPRVLTADAPIVLVVDDHPTNRKLLAIQLGLIGLRAEMAEDGKAAFEMWQGGRFALIITDCHMPNMDGYELTRAIRKIETDEARPRTPIVAWTANVLVGEMESCHAAGMDELLIKPVRLIKLEEVLFKWLLDSAAVKPAQIEHEESGCTQVAPIDFMVLDELFDNAADKAKILQDFIAHIRSDLADLEAALEMRDIPAAVRIAHHMKGASLAVGACELATACLEIENSGRHGYPESADAVAAALKQLMTYLAEATGKNNDKK